MPAEPSARAITPLPNLRHIRSAQGMRGAQAEDLEGIAALLAPLEAKGILKSRSRHQLAAELPHYTVIEREAQLLGALRSMACDASERWPWLLMGRRICCMGLAAKHDISLREDACRVPPCF